MKRKIILIAHNLRSCHNVGSLLRTADGLGLEKVYLTGYTPYPAGGADERLPHLSAKIDRQIAKTALGAEKSVRWIHEVQISTVVKSLKDNGYLVIALEQHAAAEPIENFRPANNFALIVGPEVSGLEAETLALADKVVDIPMRGTKESFNVAVAAAIALYQLSVR